MDIGWYLLDNGCRELIKHVIQSHRYDHVLFLYLRVAAIILFLLWEVDIFPVKDLLVFLRILCTRTVQKMKRFEYKTCTEHSTCFMVHTPSLLATSSSHHHQYQLGYKKCPQE